MAANRSQKQRAAAIVVESIVFMVVVPLALVAIASALDQWLQWPRFTWGAVNLFVGLLFVVPGWLFAMWFVQAQFVLGEGIPVFATQKLIVQGPYAHCRNPMALGADLFYTGISIWMGSLSAIGLTMLFATLSMVYYKLIEEKRLEARFGSEYLEYKQRTPFLIPHL
ncbi:MAG: isoprenylcysteine carboxylmethyltransferase family protein [Chloroflexota bacterium]|nr:isoprenylcysteine carboxylmethyltransferase family protein [Chloroflexota bacterium]